MIGFDANPGTQAGGGGRSVYARVDRSCEQDTLTVVPRSRVTKAGRP